MSDFDGKIEFEKFPPAYRLMIKYTELENRIDKAIDYIMTNHCLHLLDKSIINSKELIDILKGNDKDE